MSATPRPLVDLPKAHLHLHFEGAMRPATLRQLCQRNGTTVPAVGGALGTFAAFQELYEAARSALTDADDLRRLVREIAEDAGRDGAVWVEIGVNVWDHLELGSADAVLELLIAAGRETAAATGVEVGWMVTADRTFPPRSPSSRPSSQPRTSVREWSPSGWPTTRQQPHPSSSLRPSPSPALLAS